jgi:hypothetical protein
MLKIQEAAHSIKTQLHPTTHTAIQEHALSASRERLCKIKLPTQKKMPQPYCPLSNKTPHVKTFNFNGINNTENSN